MASKVTHNVNMCVGVENKVQLPKKAPVRPLPLAVKTEHYYDVKLPTYEESQKKYAEL